MKKIWNYFLPNLLKHAKVIKWKRERKKKKQKPMRLIKRFGSRVNAGPYTLSFCLRFRVPVLIFRWYGAFCPSKANHFEHGEWMLQIEVDLRLRRRREDLSRCVEDAGDSKRKKRLGIVSPYNRNANIVESGRMSATVFERTRGIRKRNFHSQDFSEIRGNILEFIQQFRGNQLKSVKVRNSLLGDCSEVKETACLEFANLAGNEEVR